MSVEIWDGKSFYELEIGHQKIISSPGGFEHTIARLRGECANHYTKTSDPKKGAILTICSK